METEFRSRSTQRNTAIDCLRVVFAALIVLAHTVFLLAKGEATICRGGYISVEFFFIVSGYFMTLDAQKLSASDMTPGDKTFRIMKRRIKGILPDFLFALLVGVAIRSAVLKAAPAQFLKNALNSVWIGLFMESTGIQHFAVMGQAWFLSSLMIVMPVCLCFLTRRNGSGFRKVGAPLLFALIMGYLSSTVGNLNIKGPSVGGSGYGSLLRAAAGLLGGCISFSIAEALHKRKLTDAGRRLVTLLEISLYVAVIVCTFVINRTQYDFLLALALVIAVGFTCSGKSLAAEAVNRLVNSRPQLGRILGRYSLCVYLYNNFFHYIAWNRPLSVMLPYYLLYAFGFPILAMLAVNGLSKIGATVKRSLYEE